MLGATLNNFPILTLIPARTFCSKYYHFSILQMRKLRLREVLWCPQYYIARKLMNLVLGTLLCPFYRWENWGVQAWEIKWLSQGGACGWEAVWSLFLISDAEFFPWFEAQRQKQHLTLLITHLEAGSELPDPLYSTASWKVVLDSLTAESNQGAC